MNENRERPGLPPAGSLERRCARDLCGQPIGGARGRLSWQISGFILLRLPHGRSRATRRDNPARIVSRARALLMCAGPERQGAFNHAARSSSHCAIRCGCLAGLSLIAGTTGASAEPKRGGPPAAARPAAPAMARPAAPAFHPAPQRPAMAVHQAPRFAAPSRSVAPHVAASRPSFQRPAMAPRPARPAPHIAESRRPSAPSAISARSPRQEKQQRQERIAQPAGEHELQTSQRRQLAQQRQHDALSRRSTERQTRIDRLQQRVQQLQAQKPQGRRAQRTLAAQQRLLQREQLSQKRDLAQQQKLGMAPSAAQHSAAANAVQAAARGRFAARFRNNADPGAQAALAARLNGWAPRKAWRNHVHAAFVPWLGPVFWTYAYADIFDYTFWPAAYDDAYWLTLMTI